MNADKQQSNGGNKTMRKQEKRSVACGTLREEPRREGMKKKMNERNEQTNEKKCG